MANSLVFNARDPLELSSKLWYMVSPFISLKMIWNHLGMLAHACNSDTQKAVVGGSLVQGQPGLCSEFQKGQIYVVSPCLKEMDSKYSKFHSSYISAMGKIRYTQNKGHRVDAEWPKY